MDIAATPFRAPAPTPHTKPLGAIRFVLTASRNPLLVLLIIAVLYLAGLAVMPQHAPQLARSWKTGHFQ